MVSREEYELEYSLYEAESTLYREILEYDSKVSINEASDLEYIEESVKDSITKYLAKIVSAMQKAWSKFQDKVTEKETKFLRDNKNRILNAKISDITIKNFKKIDHNKVDAVRVIPWSDEMKQIKTKEEFLQRYYPQLDSSKFKESLKNIFYGDSEDIELTSDKLEEMYNFCTSKFNDLKDKVAEGIKVIDASNQSIVNSLNQVSTAEESYLFFESVLLEDGDDKMEIVDNSVGTNAENAKSILKAITVYVTVSSSIITTKMTALLKEFFQDLKVLRHFAKENKESNEEEEVVTTVEKIIK